SLLFFCQVDGGIRYFHVTGVQMCALPISVCTVPSTGTSMISSGRSSSSSSLSARSRPKGSSSNQSGSDFFLSSDIEGLCLDFFRSEERRVGNELSIRGCWWYDSETV